MFCIFIHFQVHFCINIQFGYIAYYFFFLGVTALSATENW